MLRRTMNSGPMTTESLQSRTVFSASSRMMGPVSVGGEQLGSALDDHLVQFTHVLPAELGDRLFGGRRELGDVSAFENPTLVVAFDDVVFAVRLQVLHLVPLAALVQAKLAERHDGVAGGESAAHRVSFVLGVAGQFN